MFMNQHGKYILYIDIKHEHYLENQIVSVCINVTNFTINLLRRTPAHIFCTIFLCMEIIRHRHLKVNNNKYGFLRKT